MSRNCATGAWFGVGSKYRGFVPYRLCRWRAYPWSPLMDIDNLPDMLRVDEAAAVLRISRSRAYEEVNRGPSDANVSQGESNCGRPAPLAISPAAPRRTERR